MKKYISLLIFLGLFAYLPAHAQLLGFQDGNMFDPATGQWQCMFLMDGNCYDLKENVLATRPPGYTPPVIVPDTAPTQTVYVPVPASGNSSVNQPIASGGVPAPAAANALTTINQPVTTHMEPAYSESYIFYNIIGYNTAIVPALVQIKQVNGEPTPTARFMMGKQFTPGTTGYPQYELQKNLTVVFDGKTIYQNGIGHSKGQEVGGFADVTDLTPGHTYDYSITYSEPGRDATVLNKQLTVQ